jgi:hypothetical protein
MMRYLAPVLVPLSAVVAATVTELALTAALDIGPLPYWLMKHDTVSLVLALVQFAAFVVSSGLAVAALTRALLRQTRFVIRWPLEHLIDSAVLYGIVFSALFAHVNCADSCEGLILGAIKFWGLLAAGGIVANLWMLRKASIAPSAF